MSEIVNDFETADDSRVISLGGHRVRGTFPTHWGKPPDDLEERRTWIARNIELGKQRLDRGEEVEGQRVKTGRQALAALERRQRVEAEQRRIAEANEWMRTTEANHIRLRMLELKQEGPQ